jgi:DNA-binding NarL/FixJ family response regulator
MSPEKEKTRILIVEDHPIFRMGMRDLINQESDMMVCGEAEDVSGGRKAIEQLQPDIVIVDLSLKSSCGIDLVRETRLVNKKLPVLVLSMHDESLHAERCLLAGARGYIMKQETSEFVVKAIRQILVGNIFISQKIMGNILNKFQNRPESIQKSPMENLTDRELEVFRLIGKGYSSGKIASQLSISVKTVGTYRERIKEKLGLKHGGDLAKYAVLWVETDIFATPL